AAAAVPALEHRQRLARQAAFGAGNLLDDARVAALVVGQAGRARLRLVVVDSNIARLRGRQRGNDEARAKTTCQPGQNARPDRWRGQTQARSPGAEPALPEGAMSLLYGGE